MKKIILVLSVIGCCAGFTACGGGFTEKTTTTKDEVSSIIKPIEVEEIEVETIEVEEIVVEEIQ